MTTWIEQRVGALEARLADLSKQMRGLAATELMLAGLGDPNLTPVTAVQGTHYWDITNQVEYVNITAAVPPGGTVPEGTDWGLLGGAAPPPALPHNILSATHPDTTPAAVARGDVMTGQGAPGTTWRRLGIGVNTRVLKSDGTDAVWGQVSHGELSGVGANDHHAAFTAADHTAIGDGAPHHAAVTLDANADTVLSLAAQQVGLDTQAANRVWAGPAAGADAVPTMRALVSADLPAIAHATTTDRNAANSHPASAIREAVTGRLMQSNAVSGDLEASTVVKSGAGVLTLTAAAAYQLDANASGGVLVRAAATPLTAGRVLFATDGNTAGDDANLVWNSTLRYFIFGQAAAAAKLLVGRTTPISDEDLLVFNAAKPMGIIVRGQTNATYSAHLRLVEENSFLGGFINYEGAANLVQSGTHNVNDASTANDIVAITIPRATGNVLIGTTTDSARLTVQGGANIQQFLVTGHTTQAVATPIAQITRNDTAAGVSALLGLTALGSGADGDGGAIYLRGKSSTTAAQDMARIQYLWNDATHASRKADLVLSAFDTSEREGIRIRGNGSEAALGFYGVAPVARQLLATGGGATVDQVITALQNLGLLKQA